MVGAYYANDVSVTCNGKYVDSLAAGDFLANGCQLTSTRSCSADSGSD
jgi:hypothetical protein